MAKRLSEAELAKEVDICKKLLALAGSPNEHEASLAMEKLGLRLARLGMSLEDLSEENQTVIQDLVRSEVDGITPLRSRFRRWESVLAHAVALVFDCTTVNMIYQRPWRVAFLGRKQDVALSIHFYKYLRQGVDGMGYFHHPVDAKERGTYQMSMVQVIATRLQDAYKAKEEALSPDCLSLVPVIKQEVENFKKGEFPNLKNARNFKYEGSMDAWRQGQRDGEKIPLSRPIEGSGKKHEQIS